VKTIVSACVTSAFVGALSVYVAASASPAPDVEGMTQEDAVAAIEEDGGIPKVSVTFGDRRDAMGACLVTRATDGSYVRPIPADVYYGPDEGELAEAGELPGVPDLVAGE
jgi:hypothetical protein